MAYRTRIIKHDFFLNEYLAELKPETRLLYIGLWVTCDREGRLEDRPKKIKAEIFPYDDFDIEQMLTDLAESPDKFIIRYSVNGNKYIYIPTFTKHQSIHPNEKKSIIPEYPEISCNFMERPEIPPSSSSTSTSTINSSSMAEEKEIDKLEERERTLVKWINDLWPSVLITPNTRQFDNIEELKQFPDEQILEALAAARENHVRQGNWIWIFNRLKFPEQYGVETKNNANPDRINRLRELYISIRDIRDDRQNLKDGIELATLYDKSRGEFLEYYNAILGLIKPDICDQIIAEASKQVKGW